MTRIFQNLKTCNTCTPANISKQTPAKAAHLQANTDLQENSRPFHSFACNCYPYTMFEYNTEKKYFLSIVHKNAPQTAWAHRILSEQADKQITKSHKRIHSLRFPKPTSHKRFHSLSNPAILHGTSHG